MTNVVNMTDYLQNNIWTNDIRMTFSHTLSLKLKWQNESFSTKLILLQNSRRIKQPIFSKIPFIIGAPWKKELHAVKNYCIPETLWIPLADIECCVVHLSYLCCNLYSIQASPVYMTKLITISNVDFHVNNYFSPIILTEWIVSRALKALWLSNVDKFSTQFFPSKIVFYFIQVTIKMVSTNSHSMELDGRRRRTVRLASALF